MITTINNLDCVLTLCIISRPGRLVTTWSTRVTLPTSSPSSSIAWPCCCAVGRHTSRVFVTFSGLLIKCNVDYCSPPTFPWPSKQSDDQLCRLLLDVLLSLPHVLPSLPVLHPDVPTQVSVVVVVVYLNLTTFARRLSWWLVGIPFSLAIIAFDECRKLFIRKYPNSQISQIIDY